jgi:hypothetical protein
MNSSFSRVTAPVLGGAFSDSPLDSLLNLPTRSFAEGLDLMNDAVMNEVNSPEPDLDNLMYAIQLKKNLQSFMQRMERIASS